MARPQGNGDGFDTIDLTLSSSPEPESQPRIKEQIRTTPQQPQPYSGWSHSASRVTQNTGHIPRVKAEFGHPPRIKPELGQPSNVQRHPDPLAAYSRASDGSQQTWQIHPSHLESIIATTNSNDLRKVLLELCQLSPALSGALVRGLAPYSIVAQTMVGKHRSGGRPPLSPRRNMPPGQKLRNQTGQARHHTQAFQSTPAAWHEPYRPSPPSSWRPAPGRPSTPSPDRELRRPGPSAQKTMRPNATRESLQNLPKSSFTINRTSDTSTGTQKMSASQSASSRTTMTCVKCHEPFSDYAEPCIYHPGRKIKLEDGRTVWSCCQEDGLSVGCDFGGSHITDHDGWGDSPDTKVV